MQQELLLLVKANCEVVALELDLLQAEGKWYSADWRGGGGKKVFRQGGQFASPGAGSGDTAKERAFEIAKSMDKAFTGFSDMCRNLPEEQGQKIKEMVFSINPKKIQEDVSKALKEKSVEAQKAFDETLKTLEKNFDPKNIKKTLGKATEDSIGFAQDKIKESSEDDDEKLEDRAAGIAAAIGVTVAVAGIAAAALLSNNRSEVQENFTDPIANIGFSAAGGDVMISTLDKDSQKIVKDAATTIASHALIGGMVAASFLAMRAGVYIAADSNAFSWKDKTIDTLEHVKKSIDDKAEDLQKNSKAKR
jgi:hypothetical protein